MSSVALVRRSRWGVGRRLVFRGVLLGVVLVLVSASSAWAGSWQAVVTDASSADAQATPIDLGSNVAGSPFATGGNGGLGVAISPDANKAYVVNSDSHSVTPVVLGASPAAETPIDLGSGRALNFIAISPNGRVAYVSDPGSDEVVPLDLTTSPATVEAAISVADPEGIAFSPDGSMAYVADNSNTGAGKPAHPALTPITVATNTAGIPIALPAGTEPFWVAVTPDGSRALVSDAHGSSVYPVTLASGTVGAAIAVGSGPVGIAITPNGAKAYVANSGSGTVTPITLATDTAGPAIMVGGEPYGIAVTPDGKSVYVTDGTGTTVTPIDTATGTAGSPITVSNSPRGIAITPDQAPVANFTVASGAPGAATSFDASSSTVRFGTIARYVWSFGDGAQTTTTTPTTTHVYSTAGTYTATVTETDSAGTSVSGEVFTGQTASTVGNPSAQTARSVVITAPGVGAPAVQVSSSQLVFGTVAVGTPSPAQTLTITNTGNAPLAISSSQITGSAAPDYKLSADGCTGQTVAAGASCTTGITFTPSADGTRNAQVAFSDNASGSPHTVFLTGTGTSTGTVTGTVEDGTRSGDPPLRGSAVTLCTLADLFAPCVGAYTDSHGRYEFSGATSGRHIVTINPPSGSTLSEGTRIADVTVGQTVDAVTVLTHAQPLPSNVTISSGLGTQSGGHPTLYFDSPFEITLPPLKPLGAHGTPNTSVETTIFVEMETAGTDQLVLGSALSYLISYNASGNADAAVVSNVPLPGTIGTGFSYIIGGIAAPPGSPTIVNPRTLAAATIAEAQTSGLQQQAHGQLTLAITPIRSIESTPSTASTTSARAHPADVCQDLEDATGEAVDHLEEDHSRYFNDRVRQEDPKLDLFDKAEAEDDVEADRIDIERDISDLNQAVRAEIQALVAGDCKPPPGPPPPPPPDPCSNDVFAAELDPPCPQGGQIPVDPSGFVLTRGGVPLERAKVVLERSNTRTGPFTPPPNGNAVMAANNRRNPDFTDLNGHFGWDVFPGFYRVRASRHGCHGTALSRTRMVPPPVTNLRLVLSCPGLRRTPTRTRILSARVHGPDTIVIIQERPGGRSKSRRGLIGMVTLDVRGRQRGFEFIETRTGRARIVLPGHFRRNTRLTARYTGNARYAPSHSSARP